MKTRPMTQDEVRLALTLTYGVKDAYQLSDEIVKDLMDEIGGDWTTPISEKVELPKEEIQSRIVIANEANAKKLLTKENAQIEAQKNAEELGVGFLIFEKKALNVNGKVYAFREDFEKLPFKAEVITMYSYELVA